MVCLEGRESPIDGINEGFEEDSLDGGWLDN
jgi:hypothetical protein